MENFINQFLSMMLSGVGSAFNALDSFKFWGFSLLDYMISVCLLGVVIPIIVTLVKNRPVRERRE